LRPDELQARFGPIRPPAALRADPTPQSLSERLLLLGWLLPRPAAPRNPPRYLLPPELRRWLPQPPQFAAHGALPPATPPPVLAVSTALLLACVAEPLPLCADGSLARPALRRLAPLLADVDTEHQAAFVTVTWPLLQQLGLVIIAQRQATLSPAAARFLKRPATERLALLRDAWIGGPDCDAWLRPLLIDRRGIDWPCLRRRLCAWAASLPADQAVEPAASATVLAATHGPLADAQTHGFRRVDRAPWQPRRATAIWQAALAGPLTVLGYVAWNDQGGCARMDAAAILADQPAFWHAGERTIAVPAVVVDGDILTLARFASVCAGDRAGFRFALDRRSLACAERAGYHPQLLRRVLERRLLQVPPALAALLESAAAPPRIEQVLLFSSDSPQVLDRLAQQRSVRRTLAGRLAPGLALVQPERLPALERALLRQGLAPISDRPAPPLPERDLLPGERAALLLACAYYRRYAPDDAPLPPSAILEERLRSGLPPVLREAVGKALEQMAPPAPAQSDMGDGLWFGNACFPVEYGAPATPQQAGFEPGDGVLRPGVEDVLAMPMAGEDRALPPRDSAPWATDAAVSPAYAAQLRHAIARRDVIELKYRDAQGRPSERRVRPLELYRDGPDWYLTAFCLLRRAERSFRLDRIQALEQPGEKISVDKPPDTALSTLNPFNHSTEEEMNAYDEGTETARIAAHYAPARPGAVAGFADRYVRRAGCAGAGGDHHGQ